MNSEAVVDGGNRGESPPSSSGPVSSSQLLDLVRAGMLAPSPDNNQPWRFRFDGDVLTVYEDRERRLPSDVLSLFSLIALGSAVENIVIEATRNNLHADVAFVAGDAADSEVPRADLCFSPGAAPDPLAAVLEARSTNRGPFRRQAIAPEALDETVSAATSFGGCQVTWLTDRARIRFISKVVAVADRLRLERQEFHAELFRQLRLTPAEAESTRDGLDVRTLGLPFGGVFLLRSLKPWPLVRALNRFGLSRMLTVPSAAIVRKSGAIGLLTASRSTSDSFFTAGRAFERLWLTATRLGLSLHPLGSVPIFVGHHELLGGRGLDPRHARLAGLLTARIRDALPEITGQTLVMAFRLGVPRVAPARSLRRPVDEVLDPAV